MKLTLKVATATVALISIACGPKEVDRHVPTPYGAFLNLHNTDTAPGPIKAATSAVVRIGTPFGGGTGSFISPEGHLLTNDHVVGAGNCAKEGCYLELWFNDEAHTPSAQPPTKVQVYAKPVMATVQADAAVYEIYKLDGEKIGERFRYPIYLKPNLDYKIASHDETVYSVGHPHLGLKKWSQGVTLGRYDQWYRASLSSLGGSSGSPILNDQGELVGILHRSTDGDTATNRKGTGGQTIFSPINYALEKLETGSFKLKSESSIGAFRSFKDPIRADREVDDISLLVNSRSPKMFQRNANTDATEEVSVLDYLGGVCDQEIASPNYESKELAWERMRFCTRLPWLLINCNPEQKLGFHHCPSHLESIEWERRAEEASRVYRRYNFGKYQEIYAWTRISFELETYKNGGFFGARIRLAKFFEKYGSKLDVPSAYWSTVYNYTTLDHEFEGVKVKDYWSNYRAIPSYENQLEDIAFAYTWLPLPKNEEIAFLNQILAEPGLRLGDYLDIEAYLHRSHLHRKE